MSNSETGTSFVTHPGDAAPGASLVTSQSPPPGAAVRQEPAAMASRPPVPVQEARQIIPPPEPRPHSEVIPQMQADIEMCKQGLKDLATGIEELFQAVQKLLPQGGENPAPHPEDPAPVQGET